MVAMALDPGRLCVVILYLRSQEAMYVEDCHGMQVAATALLEEDVEKQVIPFDFTLPDMCYQCGSEGFDLAYGGRIRNGCYKCRAEIPWRNHQLRYLWSSRMAEILQVSETVLESYLAAALWYVYYRSKV